jgi:hypothetical protein
VKIPVRFWTRRCRGCSDGSPHDSHLTWLGRIALGLLTDLRHAATDEVSADVFLTDPGLALVHADMGAWLEAHPCVCEALCECEER